MLEYNVAATICMLPYTFVNHIMLRDTRYCTAKFVIFGAKGCSSSIPLIQLGESTVLGKPPSNEIPSQSVKEHALA